MGESKKRGGYDEAYAHHCQPATEEAFYEILETEPDDGHRYAGKKNLAYVIEIVVAFEAEKAAAKLRKHRPKHHDGGANGGSMKDKVELENLVGGEVNSQYLTEYLEVSA